MKRIFKVGFAVSVLAVTALVLAAASKPKATGDAYWVNETAGGTHAHVVFNAIATNGRDAKGSLLYDDGKYKYTMDVQLLSVSADGKTARFAGQVTANLTEDSVDQTTCCAIGHWIFYKVQDNGEPGSGDLIWGEDLTAVNPNANHETAQKLVDDEKSVPSGGSDIGGFPISRGNLQVHKN